jgi:site-specific recombinase
VAIAIDYVILNDVAVTTSSAQKKRITLLDSNNPLTSGAVIYAAIAGVCLFLAGLIAGFHDNLSAYNKIPERIAAIAWLAALVR